MSTKKHGNTRTMLEKFERSRFNIKLIEDGIYLDDTIRQKIKHFFEHFSDNDRNETWRKTIATWIRYGVTDNWITRRDKLSALPNGTYSSKDRLQLIYGESWQKIYEHTCDRLATTSTPNRVEFWLEKGYTKSEAKDNIKEYQKKISLRSPVTNKGSRDYSVRCNEYWTRRGYSDDEAANMVSIAQRRDKEFFCSKYGVVDGAIKYDESCSNKKKAWEAKTTEERINHGLKTAPKTFNANGQEMQVIHSFLKENNIDPQHCMFGAPNDQFWQNIPDHGFRRYDLAVFADNSKRHLKMIVEYHGYAHINFSDFNESMRDERFKVNGYSIPSISVTYGSVYDNDMIKRQHILSNFEGVEYVVIWKHDFKDKRMNLNDLLSKR